jgi:hypothetical protein
VAVYDRRWRVEPHCDSAADIERRYGDWQSYCSSDAWVLTRKRERPTTLRWHHKIPRTRISSNGVIIETSSHESDSLHQSISVTRSLRQHNNSDRTYTVAYTTARFASVARGYSALVRHLQPVDWFNNRIPWCLVCYLANQLESQQQNSFS